jgi:hypothetical protein
LFGSEVLCSLLIFFAIFNLQSSRELNLSPVFIILRFSTLKTFELNWFIFYV